MLCTLKYILYEAPMYFSKLILKEKEFYSYLKKSFEPFSILATLVDFEFFF
jgi:hypothetical protein